MAHMEDSQKKIRTKRLSPFKKGIVLFLLLFVIFAPIHPAHAQLGTQIREAFVGSLDYMFNEMIPALFIKMVVSIAGQFAKLSGVAGDMIVTYGLSNNFIDSFAVTIGWHIVRDVANIFFILVLIIIAFGTILGSQHFGWKERLPELIIAVFAVNFSKIILGVLIDLIQILTLTFFSALAEGGGGNFTDVFKLGEIMSTTIQVSSWIRLAASIVAGLVVLFLAGLLFYVAFRMIWRVLVLQALIVMAPLAFLSRAIPHGEEYFNKWMHEFLKQLLFGPFVAFFLWLLVVIFTTQQISLSTAISGHLLQGLGVSSITGVDVAHAQLTASEGSYITYFLVPFVFMLVFIQMAETAADGLAAGAGKLASGGMKLGRLGMKGAQLSARGGLAGLRAARSVGGAAAGLATPLASRAAQGLGGLAGGLGGLVGGAGRGTARQLGRLRAATTGRGPTVGEAAGQAGTYVAGKAREFAPAVTAAAERAKRKVGKTVRAGVLAGYMGSQVAADKVKDVAGKVREFGARQVDEFQASDTAAGARRGAELGGEAAAVIGGAPGKATKTVAEYAKKVAETFKKPILGGDMEAIGYEARKDKKDLEALDKPKYDGLSANQLADSANAKQLDAMSDGTMKGSDKNTRRAGSLRKIERGGLDNEKDVKKVKKFIKAGAGGSTMMEEKMMRAWESRMGATNQRERIKELRSAEAAGAAGKPGEAGGEAKEAGGAGGMAPDIAEAVRRGARAGVLEGLGRPEKAKKTPEEKQGWVDKMLSMLGMGRDADGDIPSQADIQERIGQMEPEELENLGRAAAEMSPEDVEGDNEASILHDNILGAAEEEGAAAKDEGEAAKGEGAGAGAAEELRQAARELRESLSGAFKAGGVSDSKNDTFMKLVDKLSNNGKQNLKQHLGNRPDHIKELIEFLKGNQQSLPRAIALIIRSG